MKPSIESGAAPARLLRLGSAVAREIERDNTGLIAAGVAFFAFLAAPPGFAAFVSVYGLIADPATVRDHVTAIAPLMPPPAQELIASQLDALIKISGPSLGFGLGVSLLLSLWSATKAVRSLVAAINVAYNVDERRGWIARSVLGLTLTTCAMIAVTLALAAVMASPAVLTWVGVPIAVARPFSLLRWPALGLFVAAALAVLYRLAVADRSPRWRDVAIGSLAATLLWLAGSFAFALYVERFAAYDRAYGTIAGVAVLLLWLYLAAWTVLLGAELNAVLDEQRRSVTEG